MGVRSISGVFLTILAAMFVGSCSASPIVVTDDLGRTIVLLHPPQRIISLEPSVTEVLFSVGAGKKIVADDFYSDFPAEAKNLLHVNGVGPSRETVISLQPDLLILFDQTFTVQKADEWQKTYGAPVYVTNAGTYDGVVSDISRIGSLVGTVKETEKVVTGMERSAHTVAAAVKHRRRPTVFVVIWDRPLMTAGRGTFIDDMITLAGGVDVASRTVSGYPTYSPEQLVADDPDVLLTGNALSASVRTKIAGLAGLNLHAFRDGNSFAVPDDWTARPGPRLALGLVAIANVLHPDCFKH